MLFYIENKLAVEKARGKQPLSLETVRNFLNYFAHKNYENGEEKNEFFNSFIRRVVLFDDYCYIFYNTKPNDKLKIRLDKQLLADLADLREQKSAQNEQKISTRFEKFKSGALGGEEGI